MTIKDPYTCSDEEIRIQIARDNLARYGTTYAPANTVEPVLKRVAPRAAAAIPAHWFKVVKVCPHCGLEKNVGRDFGIVVRRGVESAAGWCRKCRASTNYHSAPRKNRTRNTTD